MIKIHNIEDINAIMLVNKQLLESLSIDSEEIKKFLKKYYKFIIKNIE